MNASRVQLNALLRSVLEAINHEPAGIAFMEDEAGVLQGVLTDGDVRRLLLEGHSIDTPVSKDLLKDFVFAKVGDSIDTLLKKTDKRIRIIPIVDENGRAVDYFRYEHKTRFVPVAEPNLKGNELKYVTDAVLSTWISSRGEYLDRFESDFSDFCGSQHGVAVSNGTVALHLALTAAGIGPGDEVIVPDFTFAATINSVLHCGATPVIVDVLWDSWCIDPARIEAAISPRTKAIIPVHIYGQPCDMDEIMQLAEAHELFVLEDAAEAHGAKYKGHVVGSHGHAATFSFFGNKIITTGEGGMVTTSDSQLDDRMRVLRDHGMSKEKRYWHDHVGFNYRMTNIQAAIGCAQLEHMQENQAWRKALEDQYKEVFKGFALTFQADLPDRERARWLISGLLGEDNDKDRFIEHFRQHNIDIRPFFYPLSHMPIYKEYARECSVSTEISNRGISLPTIRDMDIPTFAGILGQWT